MSTNVTWKGKDSFLPSCRGNRNSCRKDKEQTQNSWWFKNQRVAYGWAQWWFRGLRERLRPPPKPYQKLFFSVLHLVFGAFYLSYPDLGVYLTELKTEQTCLKSISQTLTSTFTILQNTVSLHFNWPLTQWMQRTNKKPLFPAWIGRKAHPKFVYWHKISHRNLCHILRRPSKE